jgi:DNA-binding response OmpR family regulator
VDSARQAARTILVIDDDRAVLESYGRLLRRFGHSVLLADDCDRVRSDPESLRGVDLLILDYRMPGTNGLDLLAALRLRPPERSRRPAALLISALLSDDLRARAARLGVVEIIEKPVDPARLLASVRAALAGSSEDPGAASGAVS